MTIRALLPRFVLAASAIVVGLVAPSAGAAQNLPEKFTGFAINMNGVASTATVDFTIQRWSTDAEREQLLSIIKEHKDPTDPLLKALQKMPKVGGIRTPKTLAWDLRYAHETKLEGGGRRIVLATDRPMGFREVENSGRSMDYPFTLLEIHLDANDKGEGKILWGTKIFIDKKNTLVIENYAQQPVRFNEIKRLK